MKSLAQLERGGVKGLQPGAKKESLAGGTKTDNYRKLGEDQKKVFTRILTKNKLYVYLY